MKMFAMIVLCLTLLASAGPARADPMPPARDCVPEACDAGDRPAAAKCRCGDGCPLGGNCAACACAAPRTVEVMGVSCAGGSCSSGSCSAPISRLHPFTPWVNAPLRPAPALALPPAFAPAPIHHAAPSYVLPAALGGASSCPGGNCSAAPASRGGFFRRR